MNEEEKGKRKANERLEIRREQFRSAAKLLVANGSTFERDKKVERDVMMRRSASETGSTNDYLNRVGGQDELVLDGSSLLIDGDGSLHPPARAFETAWLSVDFERLRRAAPVKLLVSATRVREDRKSTRLNSSH